MKGKWVTHNEVKQKTFETCSGGVMCSACGYKTYNRLHKTVGCPFKYCPNCGAKMSGYIAHPDFN